MASEAQAGVRGEIDAKLQSAWGWTPYRLLAGFAIAGCAAAALADFVMWFLTPGYNPVAQTISELGAGPHHEVQDAGIALFAAGVFALGVAFILRSKDGWRSWLVRAAFVILAIDICLIAFWNEYGDGEPGGLVIHKYLVLLLYLLAAVILWFGDAVTPARRSVLSSFGRGAAIFWLVAAPVFYLLPDSIDGAYERFLALILIGAVASAALALYRDPSKETP